MPAILGAAAFVFAEMLGSFAVATVIGVPIRFHVVTTGIWLLLTRQPAELPGRRGDGDLAVRLHRRGDVASTPKMLGRRDFTTITGKAFRPRVMDMGRWRPVLFAICALYVTLAAILPLIALVFASVLRFNTTNIADVAWTFGNYESVFNKGATTSAMQNSVMLAFMTATHRRALDGRALLVHLPHDGAGPELPRIRRDVPAGRPAHGLLARPALGLDQHAVRHLRHASGCC